MKRSKIGIVVLTVVVSFFISTGSLYIYTEHKVNEDVTDHLHQTLLKYHAMYASVKAMAETAFIGVSRRESVMELFAQTRTATPAQMVAIHDRMHELLSDDYGMLIRNNLKQLHFHLANNHSFLRMHEPDHYGDDLTYFRETVRRCNAEKRFIEGFEEGRFFHGFRFVFPLFDQAKNHLGSVELSYTAGAFVQAFEKQYEAQAYFIEKNNLLDKKLFPSEKIWYKSSGVIPNFSYNYAFKDPQANEVFFSELKKQKEVIDQGFLSKKPFAFTTALPNRAIVIFIPIYNIDKEPGAYLVVMDSSDHIVTLKKDFWKFLGGIVLLHALVLIFVMRNAAYQNSLQEYNGMLNEKVAFLLEEENKKQLMLLHQNRLAQMGELLSMIAHQWKQPLSVITSVSSSIRMGNDLSKMTPEFLIEKLDRIDSIIAHMSETIAQFSNFHRPANVLTCNNIDTLVRNTLEMIGPQLSHSGIKVDLDLLASKQISCYANEIEQVFLNLLQNAYEELVSRNVPNPKIHISSVETDKTLEYTFEDNAGGIESKILGKIFDPYFTTKSLRNGTGLGLYMSKMIIESHCNGKIRVENKETGARFTVVLPKNECAEAES